MPTPRPDDDPVVARLRQAGCVFAEEEAAVLRAEAAADAARLESLLAQRLSGRPLEHVVGWVRFHGVRVLLGPGVFVPRRRTEHVADLTVGLARGDGIVGRPTVVELCCGAAAVGVVVLRDLADVDLVVVDLDTTAVRSARRNLGDRALVLQGDLDEPLPDRLRGRVDVLVANAPYVPSAAVGTMPPEARDHEPLVALDGGPDGLDVARRVVARAPHWLRPGGHLVIETSPSQAPDLCAAFESVGLAPRVSRDEERAATAVVGRLVEPSAPGGGLDRSARI